MKILRELTGGSSPVNNQKIVVVVAIEFYGVGRPNFRPLACHAVKSAHMVKLCRG